MRTRCDGEAVLAVGWQAKTVGKRLRERQLESLQDTVTLVGQLKRFPMEDRLLRPGQTKRGESE